MNTSSQKGKSTTHKIKHVHTYSATKFADSKENKPSGCQKGIKGVVNLSLL